MKFDRRAMLLYAVTDRAWTGRMSLYDQVEAALKNGVTCVQLREKELDDEKLLKEADKICGLCHKYGVPFIINDNVEIAVRCGADGIHVGQDDMNPSEVRKRVGDDMIIGVSAHNVEEALNAVSSGADYLGVGAVFGSSTKKNVSDMPLERLRAICDAVDVPIVAIGGISAENINRLKDSGVDGVAVVSAIFAAENPGKATAELLRLAQNIVNKKLI